MKTQPRRVRKLLPRLLIFVLVLNSFIGLIPSLTPVKAQNRVIVINADQPNVWTLEQAHYLLAQMHRRNLDLKATGLGELDPNEINGLRFDVLRQLIDLGVKFDQAEGETNRLIADNQNFNAERRQSLLTRRDELQDESLGLTRDISDLQSEKATAASQEDKDSLDARIAAKTSRRAEVDKRIEQINEELKTLNAPSGNLKATEAPAAADASKLPKSVFDKAFEEAAKKQIDAFNEAPKLNATLRLENFLQMQYEIIAKQLTLLRDEVGPGERLLFLELPQTVNVTHNEADNKWAQSWWKIVGYMKREQAEGTPSAKATPTPTPTRPLNPQPITTAQDYNSVLHGEDILVQMDEETGATQETPKTVKYIRYVNKFVNLDTVTPLKELDDYLKESKAVLENRQVRTVDLIPRQSSLNVSDMKLRVKSGALSAVASFLFGFGARLNVQRQREQFSQFVQQELYSSAFGKGSREFGWTFTPMPGTDRLQSGVRTTYAAVVVPQAATFIVLESNGCYFPRVAYQPNSFADTKDTNRWGNSRTSRGCGNSKAFVVPIPSGGLDGTNDFWVEGVSYQPVGKGERVVVLISGKNFSAQIGVLVNGVPLPHAIGLAQPLIRDDSEAFKGALTELKSEKVRGRIERVDANKIVFSFEMPVDFAGTPTITLIAPGRAVDINWLPNVDVNEKAKTSLRDYPIKMFGHEAAAPAFRIDSVEAFRSGRGVLTALIRGAGFKPTTIPPTRELFINGINRSFRVVSPALIEVSSFPVPSEDSIQVTLVYGDNTIKSKPVSNPASLKINSVTVLSYEAASAKSPAVLIVKIEGSGFPEDVWTSIGQILSRTPTEVILRIIKPDAVAVVTLTDWRTGASAQAVVMRKPPPK